MYTPMRFICFFIVFSFSCISYAQDYSAFWKPHFSYNKIVSLSQGNDRVYAASENAIFVHNTLTNEQQTVTTVNGLSGDPITTIHYSEAYELLLVGYENGLIEVVFDDGSEILSVVDIFEKPTIQPDNKRINHFNEHNGLVYVSTDFGISVYNIERLEFDDSYFIGNGGSQIRVTQTTILGDYLYAGCFNASGTRRAPFIADNIIDFQNWEQVLGSNFLAVEAVADELYGIRSNRTLIKFNFPGLTLITTYPTEPTQTSYIGDKFVVVTKDFVYIYNTDLDLLRQFRVDETEASEFTSASILGDRIFIGTNDKGILEYQDINATEHNIILPDGPLLNTPFAINAISKNLWVTYGGHTRSYAPYGRRLGLSHLQDEEWVNIPYDSVLGARDLNKIAINPRDINQAYVSSFTSGLLEINSDVPTILYDETNSGIESFVLPWAPNAKGYRLCASTFDNNGVLWTLTTLVERPLKSYDPSTGAWQAYSFADIIPPPFFGEQGFSSIVVDNSTGTKWIGGRKFGLIGYNENLGLTVPIKFVNSEEGNMPSTEVLSLALDKQNQLWVGTDRGLRVLYNTSNFFIEEDTRLDDIVVLEDGVPQEVLFREVVTDIVVDGANNKWIATLDSGLFYFSADGQETIYHFTKSNSPLPSNRVLDIALDDTNGELYVAAANGIVSFSSGSSETKDSLAEAFIYPNPVRPNFDIAGQRVKIRDISDNVNIKITDVEGNLVAEAESNTNLRFSGYNLEVDGGTAYWNGKNMGGNIVASGVYFVMLSDLDTQETKVLKLMVVR